MKILENPTSWSRIIPREPTDGQTDTHTTKLLVTYRNFTRKAINVIQCTFISKNKIMIYIYFVTFVRGNSYCRVMILCSFWLLLLFSAVMARSLSLK